MLVLGLYLLPKQSIAEWKLEWNNNNYNYMFFHAFYIIFITYCVLLSIIKSASVLKPHGTMHTNNNNYNACCMVKTFNNNNCCVYLTIFWNHRLYLHCCSCKLQGSSSKCFMGNYFPLSSRYTYKYFIATSILRMRLHIK